MASDAAYTPACAPAVRGLEPYVPGKPLSDIVGTFG